MANNMNNINNPFLPKKADNIKSRDIIGFFVNHAKCAPVKERGHHLVIGASGTGKTIAFRYFSLKDQLKGSGNNIVLYPFIGIYISLKTDIEIWRAKDISDDLAFFYENYLNITIGYQVISSIHLCAKRNIWEINQNENTIISSLGELFGFKNSIETFEDIEIILNEELTKIINYVNNNKTPQRHDFNNTFTTSVVTFIPSLCKKIIESSSFLQDNNIPFYIFLDYYDELLPWQQRIVNTLIQRPSENYFVKLGCRPFGIYDYNTITGKSIVDALEGPVYLQYFRDELEDFKKLLLEITARRLGWALPLDGNLMNKLLPKEDPLQTAKRMSSKYKNEPQTLFGAEDLKDTIRVSEQLEIIASSHEEKRKLKSCVYQGFENLTKISEGNVGVFMELCADSWEKARQLGIKLDNFIKIPPVCQVEAIWNFSLFRYHDVEVVSPEGSYLLNLINKVSESFQKKPMLSNNRSYESWNIEIEDVRNLWSDSILKLKKALQHRVVLPTSIEGYLEIPDKLNICSYYLLERGLIDLECPCLKLHADDINRWLDALPDSIIKPPVKTSKSKPLDSHIGFLSISFRKEEPAMMVREKIRELFNSAPFKVECFDAENFGDIGSSKLLEKVRSFIHKKSTFCLSEVSNITPNTMLELGLIKGQNKLFWSLSHTGNITKLPNWISGLELYPYTLDDTDKGKYIDIVIKNNIISPLQGTSKKPFCPAWHGLTYCPYPAPKDPYTIYISYPQGHEVWNVAIKELKGICNSLGARLVVDKDMEIELTGTPDIICKWCYAVRRASIIFVDTTPEMQREMLTGMNERKEKESDPTRCFILGLAFGQRERKVKLCVHLINRGLGKKITLWQGYPEYEWSTKDELVEVISENIKNRIDKLMRKQ